MTGFSPPTMPTRLATLALALLLQGCASSPAKNDDSDHRAFKSDVTATEIPAPATAEIIPEMMLPSQGPARSPAGAASAANRAAAAKAAAGKNASEEASAGANAGSPSAHGSDPSARGKSRHGKAARVVRYVVKDRDTLMKISFELFGDVYRWRDIYSENRAKIPELNSLVKGTVLTIHVSGGVDVDRNGTAYLIKRRDSLWRISDGVYGTPWKWRKIWHNNPQLIHDPDLIFADFFLYYLMTPEDQKDLLRRRRSQRLGAAAARTKRSVASDKAD